ncbi:unnamed protein product [Anisakis simplex]|uniref:Uncharacterized protein n=1 Tax=Anisakis simplex TaxID=6269 RepID=A0A3P6P5E0_ANISI|nr:unnamed protein product [Anisakis simplex]
MLPSARVDAEDDIEEPTVKENLAKAKDASKTDDEVVQR